MALSAPATPRHGRRLPSPRAAGITRRYTTASSSPFAPNHDAGPDMPNPEANGSSSSDSDISQRSARRSLPDADIRRKIVARAGDDNGQRPNGFRDPMSGSAAQQQAGTQNQRPVDPGYNPGNTEYRRPQPLPLAERGRTLSLIKEGDSSFESNHSPTSFASNHEHLHSPSAAAAAATRAVDAEKGSPDRPDGSRSPLQLVNDVHTGRPEATHQLPSDGNSTHTPRRLLPQDVRSFNPYTHPPQHHAQPEQTPAQVPPVEKLELREPGQPPPAGPRGQSRDGATFDGSAWSDGWPYTKYCGGNPEYPNARDKGRDSRRNSGLSLKVAEVGTPSSAPSQQQKAAQQPQAGDQQTPLSQQQADPGLQVPPPSDGGNARGSLPSVPEHARAPGRPSDRLPDRHTHRQPSSHRYDSSGLKEDLQPKMSLPDEHQGPRVKLGTFGAGLVPFPRPSAKPPVADSRSPTQRSAPQLNSSTSNTTAMGRDRAADGQDAGSDLASPSPRETGLVAGQETPAVMPPAQSEPQLSRSPFQATEFQSRQFTAESLPSLTAAPSDPAGNIFGHSGSMHQSSEILRFESDDSQRIPLPPMMPRQQQQTQQQHQQEQQGRAEDVQVGQDRGKAQQPLPPLPSPQQQQQRSVADMQGDGIRVTSPQLQQQQQPPERQDWQQPAARPHSVPPQPQPAAWDTPQQQDVSSAHKASGTQQPHPQQPQQPDPSGSTQNFEPRARPAPEQQQLQQQQQQRPMSESSFQRRRQQHSPNSSHSETSYQPTQQQQLQSQQPNSATPFQEPNWQRQPLPSTGNSAPGSVQPQVSTRSYPSSQQQRQPYPQQPSSASPFQQQDWQQRPLPSTGINVAENLQHQASSHSNPSGGFAAAANSPLHSSTESYSGGAGAMPVPQQQAIMQPPYGRPAYSSSPGFSEFSKFGTLGPRSGGQSGSREFGPGRMSRTGFDRPDFGRSEPGSRHGSMRGYNPPQMPPTGSQAHGQPAQGQMPRRRREPREPREPRVSRHHPDQPSVPRHSTRTAGGLGDGHRTPSPDMSYMPRHPPHVRPSDGNGAMSRNYPDVTPSTPSPRARELYTVQSPISPHARPLVNANAPYSGQDDIGANHGGIGPDAEPVYTSTVVTTGPATTGPAYQTTTIERSGTPGGKHYYERRVTTTTSNNVTTESITSMSR